MEALNFETVYTLIMLSVFAGFSGLVAHLMRCVNDDQEITFKVCFVEWLAAKVGGIATIALCFQFDLGLWWSIVIVFLMGWFGVSNAANIMLKVFKDKFGLGVKDDR